MSLIMRVSQYEMSLQLSYCKASHPNFVALGVTLWRTASVGTPRHDDRLFQSFWSAKAGTYNISMK